VASNQNGVVTLPDTAADERQEDEIPVGPAPVERDPTRLLKLAVAALAGLSLVLAIVAASLSANNRDSEGRTAEVRRTAAAMGTAMLSYDYRHLADAKARVLRLSTGTFKQQYREAFDGGFDQLYRATKQTSRVREVNVYVNDVTSSEATSIVQVDFLVSGTGGKNRPRTAFLEFGLVHTSEGWRVDSVSTINAGNESSPPTSAPAP
jgi:hypothetical protein